MYTQTYRHLRTYTCMHACSHSYTFMQTWKVTWWAIRNCYMLFSGKTVRPKGLCQLHTSKLVSSWQRPLGRNVLQLNNNNCVLLHQVTFRILPASKASHLCMPVHACLNTHTYRQTYVHVRMYSLHMYVRYTSQVTYVRRIFGSYFWRVLYIRTYVVKAHNSN